MHGIPSLPVSVSAPDKPQLFRPCCGRNVTLLGQYCGERFIDGDGAGDESGIG